MWQTVPLNLASSASSSMLEVDECALESVELEPISLSFVFRLIMLDRALSFLFGSTAYTPDPVSQNPNDHSLPMTSSPPWKIPPMDSSRVTALILWIAVFVLSEPELVMSYTWRLTSMVKHWNEH